MERKKVFVGMSGGVDSSVSAALLKEQGYDVTGVFIKVWHPEFLECNWIDERRDAMHVAAKLNIPFETLDLEAEYKKEVVDYMIEEYKAGRTPNPDVMCNRFVKFGGFLQYAKEKGADFVATGHYARNVFNTETEKYELREGIDPEKDQSYFLWTLNQDQLKHILFPVGELQKSEVRAKAEEFDLHNAEKKDSQGLCFIGHVDMREFLSRYIDTHEGNIVNESGDVVGTHIGYEFYTIGQRQGLTITEKTTDRKPYYIIEKRPEENILVVSHEPKKDDHTVKQIELSDERYVSGEKPEAGSYDARIRYRQKKQKVTLRTEGNTTSIVFDEGQQGLSTGQSLVLYDNDVCLGGGVIVRNSP